MTKAAPPTANGKRLRAGLTTLAAAVCLLSPGAARADQEHSFALNWVRGEGAEKCASSQLLTRALEQHLGPVLHDASSAALAIEGTITQTKPGHYAMRTRVMTPQGEVVGERTIERSAQECSELTPAILLVLTLTIDPSSAAHGFPTELLARLSESPEDAGASLLADLTQSPPTARRVSATPRTPNRAVVGAPRVATTVAPAPWRVSLRAGPALAIAFVPQLTWGVGGALGLESELRLRLELGGSYWAPAASGDGSDFEERIEVAALSSHLIGCVRVLRSSSLDLATCAGGALGTRWVPASTLSQGEAPRRPYGGPIAQLSLRYSLSKGWFAALDVAAALLFPPDRFVYRDNVNEKHTIYQPHALAAFTSLTAGVRL